MKKQFLITKISKHLFYAMLAVCVFGGLFACNDVTKAKHKKGDIVYLKPDSTKAVVEDVCKQGYMYRLKIPATYWYKSENVNCDEELIY